MAFIQGNMLGFGMFVTGGAVAGVGSLVFKLPDPVTMSAVGLTLIVADVVIRFRSHSEAGWLFKKYLGGYLFFIPVWCFGIVVVLANLVSTFQLA